MTTTESPTRRITANQFHEALVTACVVRDGEAIRRLVIDAEAGCAIRIYVERWADARLLDVIPTLDGIEVHTGSPENLDG